MQFITDREGCRAVFGVSRSRFATLVSEGLPVVQAGSKGRPWQIDLREAVAWMLARAAGSSRKRLDPQQERARLDSLRSEAQELKNAQERGELVPGDELERALVHLATSARSRILAVPSKRAQALAAVETPAEAHRIVEDALCEALQEVADEGDRAAARLEAEPTHRGLRLANTGEGTCPRWCPVAALAPVPGCLAGDGAGRAPGRAWRGRRKGDCRSRIGSDRDATSGDSSPFRFLASMGKFHRDRRGFRPSQPFAGPSPW